jgi:allantoate deiminase
MTTATITQDLLQESLEKLGEFSAEGPGITRLAYDPHWCRAHRWLQGRATDLGLQATSDAAGNLFFHDRDIAPDEPVILVGSHLDTVRHGGLYDGAYGAVCGLLAAAELRGRSALPVVGMVTAEEEGSRYSGDMLGSRGLLGQMKETELDSLVDAAGITWREALLTAQREHCATELTDGAIARRFRPAAMIETHIEQGPVLESESLVVGIVDRIVGYHRLRARVSGEPRHAGTTPMRLRKDALAAAAEMVLAIEAAALEAGDPAVATTGFIKASPGLFNVVAGGCEMWIEMRHVEAGALEALRNSIIERCTAIADKRGVRLELERLAGLDPTLLSAELVATAETIATELNVPHRRMPSGAGHDAMVFAAAGVPTLLLFVPCHDGLSHCPEEYADSGALWEGYVFLREYLSRLTDVPETA